MKRPAFQFYPADWRKDVELQSCSMAAQGLWINAMCVAHECEPYGHLTVNGKAMTAAQLGRQVGLSAKECEGLLRELIDAGVARKTEEGAIFSKRMAEDERVRNARAAGGKEGAEHGVRGAEHGIKGGRPKKDKGGFKTPLPNEKEPPPSSSSSSSGNSEANASGGKPPAELAKAELWRAAVSLLQSQGMPEPQARSLFGKLSKDYPDGEIVLHAVQSAVTEQPLMAARSVRPAPPETRTAPGSQTAAWGNNRAHPVPPCAAASLRWSGSGSRPRLRHIVQAKFDHLDHRLKLADRQRRRVLGNLAVRHLGFQRGNPLRQKRAGASVAPHPLKSLGHQLR